MAERVIKSRKARRSEKKSAARARDAKKAKPRVKKIKKKARVIRKVEPSPSVFLERLMRVFIKRLKTATDNESDIVLNSFTCHHIGKIGSSQIQALQENTLCLSQMHNRRIAHGCRGDASYFENKWKLVRSFECEGNIYHTSEPFKEPYKLSSILPWICAVPDWISKISLADRSFYAVIEIKSHENDLNRALTQLKVSMSCFGLKDGFLVHYDKNRPEKDPKIRYIHCDDYLLENRDKLISSYCLLLCHYIKKVFNVSVPQEKIADIYNCLKLGKSYEFNRAMLTPGIDHSNACKYFGKKHKRKMLSNKITTNYVREAPMSNLQHCKRLK